jgi:hypothetical protein
MAAALHQAGSSRQPDDARTNHMDMSLAHSACLFSFAINDLFGETMRVSQGSTVQTNSLFSGSPSCQNRQGSSSD